MFFFCVSHRRTARRSVRLYMHRCCKRVRHTENSSQGETTRKKTPNSLRRQNQSKSYTQPKSLMQCRRSPKEACRCDLSSPGTATQSAQPCHTASTSRRARECCSQCLRAPLGARARPAHTSTLAPTVALACTFVEGSRRAQDRRHPLPSC
jgi:hypothetical protein